MPLQVRFPFLAFIHFLRSRRLFSLFHVTIFRYRQFQGGSSGCAFYFPFNFRAVRPFGLIFVLFLFLFYIISLVHFISLEVPRTWGARFVAFPNGAPFG